MPSDRPRRGFIFHLKCGSAPQLYYQHRGLRQVLRASIPKNNTAFDTPRFFQIRRHLRELRRRLLGFKQKQEDNTKVVDSERLQLDGQTDSNAKEMPFHRRRLGGDIAAIFVHAGAGYHSLQNERFHLEACSDAAKSAMTFLKNGSSAIDAVEMAIKVLEDREITNAGYGSNLAMDGTVECDATIVDHLGRSGAVGAVAQIQNPIHLARLVLDHSTKPLSLRRVPPNLLVGQGATDFAFEQGMPVLPHDCLVSPGARERWLRWKADLMKARRKEGSDTGSGCDVQLMNEHERRAEQKARSSHTHQLAGIWNESQPYSPQLTATGSSDIGELDDFSPRRRPMFQSAADTPGITPMIESGEAPPTSPLYNQLYTDSAAPTTNVSTPNKQGNDGQGSPEYKDDTNDEDDEDAESFIDTDPQWTLDNRLRSGRFDGSTSAGTESSWSARSDEQSVLPTPPTQESNPPSVLTYATRSATDQDLALDGTKLDLYLTSHPPSQLPRRGTSEDDITDTVGAIAIDCFGNIAAASSSGGIGMKHRGRTGPAALVGIGTAVLPVEDDDKSRTCVATVTSGTGEHMATTMAASTCASRLYFNHRRGKNGGSVATDEEGAIRGFVERDFMHHPSVKNSHSAGAIGVMGVKKTTDGAWLHFAHNTDSFALASMHSDEVEPQCVMSRSKGNNSVTTGARSLRHHSTPVEEPKSKRQKTAKPKRPPRHPVGVVPAVLVGQMASMGAATVH